MSEWIEWNGGECPVIIGTLVDVRHRDGDEYFGEKAGVEDTHCEVWERGEYGDNFAGDIIAYRICE